MSTVTFDDCDFFLGLAHFRDYLKLFSTLEDDDSNDGGPVDLPDTLVTSAGMHGVTYNFDEDGLRYALVGCVAPFFVMAEVDEGTYGYLQGFRIYGWTDEVDDA